MHLLTEDERQEPAEENNTDAAGDRGVLSVSIDIAGADDHLRAAGAEGVADEADVGRVMLAVAVEADDVLKAEVEGEAVAGLHAAAEAKVVGHGDDVGAGFQGDRPGAIGGTVIDDEDRQFRMPLAQFADHRGDGAFLIERRNEDHQRVLTGRGDHSSATCRKEMANRSNAP